MSGLSASEIIVMALRLLYKTKQAELKKIKKAQDTFHAAKNFEDV